MSYEIKAKRVLYLKCFRSSWRTHQNYNKAPVHIRKASSRLVSWRWEGSGNIANVYEHLKGVCKEDRAFPVVPSDRTGGTGHKVKYTKVTLDIREHFFYCEGGWEPTQGAQGGCRISILGDIQRPSGHDPGQLALGDSAWAGGVWSRWSPEAPFNLSHSVTVISNVNLCSQDYSTWKDGMEPMPNPWHFCYLMWNKVSLAPLKNPAKTVCFSSKSNFPALPKENEQCTY